MMTKTTRPVRDQFYGNERLRVNIPSHKPSWKRYGDGVANVEFISYPQSYDGRGALSITAEETAFANIGEKRDVTKTVMAELDRPAAQALYDLLGEWLAI